ncbi:ATP-binding protein [Holdemanella biformis]|uniref:ATP-binding protein n=4 Tax=Holdemanella biformis TaxID=1735 RepID=A0A395WAC2_9FIRM|nr:ATP-binding protein [Holdemanella biformis]RGU93674.1 ATP-binding protein [Holdemanella biformis]
MYMNRDILKQIIIDQKEMYLNNLLISRDYDLEENVNYCFVGIRRTGKSYMMYQQIHNLMNDGISSSQIIYVNFEDERLLEIGVDDLNTILEIGIEFSGSKGKPYLFLDEIQNVDGWEKFVRRVADMKYRINITGSNSKMLSKEIASTLGGRFMIVNVFPYSFKEYLSANHIENIMVDQIGTKKRADIVSQYEQYMTYGAFPELVDIKNKRPFLNNIYQTVYLQDIITRNKITNDFAVRLILKKIAESVTKALSFNRLTNIVKSAGISIGKQTVINYVGHMLDSYLIFSLQNYASKKTSPKYYFMDTGLLGLMLLDCKTAQLENLVAVELIRRYGFENVYFFENNIEVDFYVPSENLAIQVSMQVLGDVDTLERETRAFVKLNQFIPDTKCLLITNSEETTLKCDDIEIDMIPAWKWLLD